jgi:DNA-binding transcriptional ArsR family regulator
MALDQLGDTFSALADPTRRAILARLARQRAVQALLTGWNYVLFRLHADGTLEHLNDIGIHDDLSLTNYLAVPASARDALDAAFIIRAA